MARGGGHTHVEFLSLIHGLEHLPQRPASQWDVATHTYDVAAKTTEAAVEQSTQQAIASLAAAGVRDLWHHGNFFLLQAATIWPSGLRRWTQVPLSSDAWVRTLQLSLSAVLLRRSQPRTTASMLVCPQGYLGTLERLALLQ